VRDGDEPAVPQLVPVQRDLGPGRIGVQRQRPVAAEVRAATGVTVWTLTVDLGDRAQAAALVGPTRVMMAVSNLVPRAFERVVRRLDLAAPFRTTAERRSAADKPGA